MKSYNEMYQRVLSRRDEHLQRKRQRIRQYQRISLLAACFAVVAVFGYHAVGSDSQLAKQDLIQEQMPVMTNHLPVETVPATEGSMPVASTIPVSSAIQSPAQNQAQHHTTVQTTPPQNSFNQSVTNAPVTAPVQTITAAHTTAVQLQTTSPKITAVTNVLQQGTPDCMETVFNPLDHPTNCLPPSGMETDGPIPVFSDIPAFLTTGTTVTTTTTTTAIIIDNSDSINHKEE